MREFRPPADGEFRRLDFPALFLALDDGLRHVMGPVEWCSQRHPL